MSDFPKLKRTNKYESSDISSDLRQSDLYNYLSGNSKANATVETIPPWYLAQMAHGVNGLLKKALTNAMKKAGKKSFNEALYYGNKELTASVGKGKKYIEEYMTNPKAIQQRVEQLQKMGVPKETINQALAGVKEGVNQLSGKGIQLQKLKGALGQNQTYARGGLLNRIQRGTYKGADDYYESVEMLNKFPRGEINRPALNNMLMPKYMGHSAHPADVAAHEATHMVTGRFSKFLTDQEKNSLKYILDEKRLAQLSPQQTKYYTDPEEMFAYLMGARSASGVKAGGTAIEKSLNLLKTNKYLPGDAPYDLNKMNEYSKYMWGIGAGLLGKNVINNHNNRRQR